MGKHVTVPITGSDQLIVSGCGWITNVCISETTGSAGAKFDFVDGADETGNLIGSVNLVQGTCFNAGRHKGQWGFKNSLWFDPESGTIAGAISLFLCDTPQEWYRIAEMYEAAAAHS